MNNEIDSNERKAMQAELAKLGATDTLRKNVVRKGYAVARAIKGLGNLRKYKDSWGDSEKELEIIRLGYELYDGIAQKPQINKSKQRQKIEKSFYKRKEKAKSKRYDIETYGFKRSFDISRIEKLSGEKAELFQLLKADVLKGEVFPAVRKNEIHFYYMGGCLYKFNGISFVRDKEYEKYNQDTDGLNEYEKAKKQNENKFSKQDGTAKERQLLDKLYKHTFDPNRKSRVVVLDIEVRLNGDIGGDKKCDMVLLYTDETSICPLPKLMFVEGKVFGDNRVNVRVGSIPEVIDQVNTYTKAISEQSVAIVFEYANHIEIINALFGTNFQVPFCGAQYNTHVFGFDLFVENHLVPKAKLIVYDTPKQPNENGKHSIDTIDNQIGKNNVMWITQGNEPTLDEIWEALCK